jgi:hypothetical protein
MSNGNLTMARLIASTIISLAAIGSSVFLVATGHSVPQVFWVVEVAGVAGVVGADVLASVLGGLKK